jgi:pimeloyl-ACP methyl ester carboxylesterase
MLQLPSIRFASSVLALSLAMLAGGPPAVAEAPPAWFVDESKLPFTALSGATAYWGVHVGAGFRAEVPANWNGSLVVWAHGFRGAGLELTVDNHPLRLLLIPLGFAWAASSYSRNDYDVSSGVQTTHALVQHLNDLIGIPDRVYFTGASMGGHVTAAAIEQYPNAYDGALPICGVLGEFTAAEFSRAFLDLVSWVETGARPPGDDVLDPLVVAGPNFGCAFTNGAHLLGVPCP